MGAVENMRATSSVQPSHGHPLHDWLLEIIRQISDAFDLGHILGASPRVPSVDRDSIEESP